MPLLYPSFNFFLWKPFHPSKILSPLANFKPIIIIFLFLFSDFFSFCFSSKILILFSSFSFFFSYPSSSFLHVFHSMSLPPTWSLLSKSLFLLHISEAFLPIYFPMYNPCNLSFPSMPVPIQSYFEQIVLPCFLLYRP